jgi:hypothetical protein
LPNRPVPEPSSRRKRRERFVQLDRVLKPPRRSGTHRLGDKRVKCRGHPGHSGRGTAIGRLIGAQGGGAFAARKHVVTHPVSLREQLPQQDAHRIDIRACVTASPVADLGRDVAGAATERTHRFICLALALIAPRDRQPALEQLYVAVPAEMHVGGTDAVMNQTAPFEGVQVAQCLGGLVGNEGSRGNVNCGRWQTAEVSAFEELVRDEQMFVEPPDSQRACDGVVVKASRGFAGATKACLEMCGVFAAQAQMRDQARLRAAATQAKSRAERHTAAFQQRRDEHERPESPRVFRGWLGHLRGDFVTTPRTPRHGELLKLRASSDQRRELRRGPRGFGPFVTRVRKWDHSGWLAR